MGTEQQRRDCRLTFATYAQRTTAHGIARLYSSTSARRALWGFLVVLSTAFVVYQIITLIQKYTSFAVETELKVSYNRDMRFPSVTLCNLNALRLSRVIDPRFLPRDLLTSLPDVRQAVVTSFREQPWLLEMTGLDTANLSGDPFLQQLVAEIRAPEPYEAVENVTYSNDVVEILGALGIPVDKVMEVEPGLLRQALYAILLAYVNESVVARVGHQAADLINYCAYDGVKCNYTDFLAFQTDSFGNCFTFNSGLSDMDVRSMTHSGPKHALRLELNVEQYQYVTFLQETAGARVVIHDQGIRPYPQEEGITVAPGYHVNIGINRNGITRLGLPHGNCTDGAGNDRLPDYKYSVMGCLKLCLQRAVGAQCGCRVPLLLPSTDERIPICSFTDNKHDYLCMLRVAAGNPTLEPNCSCPESCHELKFNPLLSFGDWPNAAIHQKKQLTDMIGKKGILEFIPPGNALSKIRANLLRLDFYYQELNDIQIIQHEGYGWLSLVSDVGGQMGLWIGMSVLSLCEGIELLIDLLKVLLRPRLEQRHEVKATTQK